MIEKKNHISTFPLLLLSFILLISIAYLGVSTFQLSMCIIYEYSYDICGSSITLFILAIFQMSLSIGLFLYIFCMKKKIEEKELKIESFSSRIKETNPISEESFTGREDSTSF